MITRVHIQNFKSVADLGLDLGRVNVFIGENGCGKSNILEAIVFAAADAHDKLENEFLSPRGVRITEPQFMRSAFLEHGSSASTQIVVGLYGDDDRSFESNVDAATNGLVSSVDKRVAELQMLIADFQLARDALAPPDALEATRRSSGEVLAVVMTALNDLQVKLEQRRLITDVLIYAPENSALRTFQSEGHILPLGIKGEGLFAHLKSLAANGALSTIVDKLSLLDWFENFDIPDDLVVGERRLRIRDRYLAEGALFDQRSANEGFLLLLFYFTLFISPETPAFIIIDNIDTSLNPKLCHKLITELVGLAKAHGKQAILTTHNPAVLDGLNLHDDEQRLFVISRNDEGATVARRVPAPKVLEGTPPVRLSEAFLRGYIGGLPDNF